MKARSRTEITIETDEVLVLRHRRTIRQSWCAPCAAEVHLVTVDQAAAVARVSSRTIYRWVEAGQLHFIESPDGLLLVCLDSVVHRGEAIDCQVNSTPAPSGGK